MESTRPKRYYLLTYPRTASNLLTRILALDKQTNFRARASGGYFFLPTAMLGLEIGSRDKSIDDWTDEQRTRMMQCYQDCIADLESYVRDANEAGKSVFIKEHCLFLVEPTTQSKDIYGAENVKESSWTFNMPGPSANGNGVTHSPLNFTILPDHFLRSFLPTFLIRHPALAFASQYRAFLEILGKGAVDAQGTDFFASMTLKWSRKLYDWYSENLPAEESKVDGEVTWPLVLDGDDVMQDRDVIARYAEIIGMDPAQVRYEWEISDAVAMGHSPNPVTTRMLSTISASKGVIKGLTSDNIDIDKEVEKWKVEMGDFAAKMLEEKVRIAMPDYEFLKARKLKVKAA